MSKRKLLLRANNIESISFYPKRENKYFSLIPKGKIIKQYFFGLFKKIAKENLYYNYFSGSYYTKTEVLEELKDSYIDPEDNKIYKKPEFVFLMRSGNTITGNCDTIEGAEKEFEKIKNDKDDYLEINY